MLTQETNRQKTVFTIVSVLLIGIIAFLTFNRAIKQDDGWYISYVFRWMQRMGNTGIKAYWDYTDTNDHDIGCSFVYTLLEGTYFSIAGVSVVTMKLLNTIEAVALSYLIYRYFKPVNKTLGLIAVTCMVGWNMVHNHFFNRPELLSSLVAVHILYLLCYRNTGKWNLFFAYLLLSVLLDLHPLALFLVAGSTIVTFFKASNKLKLYCITGSLAGIVLYFAGNYIVNHGYGIFSGVILGIKVSLGDHYIPIIDTGWPDMISIAKERFRFITIVAGISSIIRTIGLLSMLIITAYLLFTRKLKRASLLTNSLVTYIVFIALSTFLSEAVSNGFRMYHAIAFGLLYFSLLYTIYLSLPVKWPAILGLLPFAVFFKESLPKTKVYYQYHLANGYYADFAKFNTYLPGNSKVLMRPTHAFFNYTRNNHFDNTYGLLRYMQQHDLSFKDALVQKHYNYITTDDLFKTEFFLDYPSPSRTSPAPYYTPLKNTGTTSATFDSLVQTGFLIPVATLYDAFAGTTVLYKVNY